MQLFIGKKAHEFLCGLKVGSVAYVFRKGKDDPTFSLTVDRQGERGSWHCRRNDRRSDETWSKNFIIHVTFEYVADLLLSWDILFQEKRDIEARIARRVARRMAKIHAQQVPLLRRLEPRMIVAEPGWDQTIDRGESVELSRRIEAIGSRQSPVQRQPEQQRQVEPVEKYWSDDLLEID
jgi:hypothetical protein